HVAVSAWLEALFNSQETVGLPWATLWGFLRIVTNARAFPNPKSLEQAFEIIRELLARPGVVALSPGPRHADILEDLLTRYRIIASMVTDAVLAAIALEQGASLASTDRDFSRFQELRWINPAP